MVWLTGGALVAAVAMIAGLIGLIVVNGAATFWPGSITRITTVDGGTLMGEVTREEELEITPSTLAGIADETVRERARRRQGERVRRRLVRSERTSDHFEWVEDHRIALDESGEPLEDRPEWAVLFERFEGDRIAAFPVRFLIRSETPGTPRADRVAAEGAAAAWAELRRHHDRIRRLVAASQAIQEDEIGALNDRLQAARIELRKTEIEYRDGLRVGVAPEEREARRALGEAEAAARRAVLAVGERFGLDPALFRGHATPEQALGVLAATVARFRAEPGSYDVGPLEPESVVAEVGGLVSEPLDAMASSQPGSGASVVAAAEAAYLRRAFGLQVELGARQLEADALEREAARYRLVVERAGGEEEEIAAGDIVRAYPANQIGFLDRVGIYFSRWGEFLTADPRKSNSEGGVFPAIIGTVTMTLVMCVFVVPFGVLAALYMREYAKAGPVISAVRIAVNNLAGVPSIVFGIFGLGFFCYVLGVQIDELFYRADPDPTFGKGGMLWASATLALLTLPVVIVSTEEALAAVPSSMREGSYACGASKWQTIRRIVLPRALPGIMTGSILAMARGAGEVAPLMLVGAVKFTDKSPVDAVAPFVHLDRSFMHLGFHIYDVGFQSQNSEAGKPMVFTTTLLLITIVALLNVLAIWLRGRLRKRYATGGL